MGLGLRACCRSNSGDPPLSPIVVTRRPTENNPLLPGIKVHVPSINRKALILHGLANSRRFPSAGWGVVERTSFCGVYLESSDRPRGRSARTVRANGPRGRSSRTVRANGPRGRSARTVRAERPARTVGAEVPHGRSARTCDPLEKLWPPQRPRGHGHTQGEGFETSKQNNETKCRLVDAFLAPV